MAASLLKTKLYIPPLRPGRVSRPTLIERLNSGICSARKLTLISAPAGFGKTTLLSEWAVAGERAVAWVSLDEGDNDLARFLTYVVAALQQIDARLGQACQEALPGSQPPASKPFIASLINEVAASNTQVVLVLDDYHTIALPAIHEAVMFLLDHMPPRLHLILASRADPPLALPRLRARGQVTEIRAIDLRFSEKETATFLNQVMKLDLSTKEIAALERRTEGWIAGLQLAALSMENLQDARRHAFVTSLTGDDRYILDYLIEEVLDRQPDYIQTFLLRTSVLSRLCGPLCDAVLQGGPEGAPPLSGQQILEHLEHNNLFLVPLDNRRYWHRYHHLFADLLRNQLEASRPDLVLTLHRRASAWYATNDLRSEAIVHSLAARDWERVTQLIDEVVNDVLGGGAYFTDVLSWLDALPQEVVRAHPRLGIVRAWMLVLMRHNETERCLHELEGTTDVPLSKPDRLQITAIRAFLARYRDDLHQAVDLSHQVLDALGAGGSAPHLLKPVVTLNLATTYRMMGDVVQSQRWFSEVLAISDAPGITFTLAAMHGQAIILATRGQLHQAAETYRRALELADKAAQQSGRAVPAAAGIHAGLGNLLREWNRLDEAARHLGRGLELAQKWQIGASLYSSYIFLARLKQAQGDKAGTLDMIRRAEQLPPAYQSARGGPVDACRAHLMLALAGSPAGNHVTRHLEAVEQWAEAHGLNADGPVRSLDDEYEHLVRARLLIAQNKADKALRLLARLLEGAETYGRTGCAIEILALQALAHQVCGDEEQALVALEQALLLAEPAGYVRTFVDEGAPMARLLRSLNARRSAVGPEYIRQLLDAFGFTSVPETSPRPEPESSRSIDFPFDALTDREMEVLRLLSTELSGPQIARELYVSVNTVKTHTKRIYAKLGVHSRFEAVAQAHELGLM